MDGYDVIIEARRALDKYVSASPRPLPNLIRLSHEHYAALDVWAHEAERRARAMGEDFGNPITCCRLLGMHIETHSGPLEVTFDPSLKD